MSPTDQRIEVIKTRIVTICVIINALTGLAYFLADYLHWFQK